jgi:hypothetical protein
MLAFLVLVAPAMGDLVSANNQIGAGNQRCSQVIGYLG